MNGKTTDETQFNLFATEALSERSQAPRKSPETSHPSKPAKGAEKPSERLSPVAKRVIASSVQIALDDPDRLTFQHTVLCQTAMPYHDQGNLRRWERRNGRVTLEIEAGRALDPRTGRFEPVPLPFGARSRIVMMHLNSRAVRTGEPTIEVGDSLTAFVRRIIGRPPRGRDITTVRDQLTALSAALVRLGMTDGDRAVQIDAKVVDAFDLWAPKSAEQKILWPSTVRLSQRYFQTLVEHAVPLDERAIAALAHSAMALDIYTWLAQRLHRIPEGREELVPWPALHQQFSAGYARLRDFRAFFLAQLRTVLTQYPEARIEVANKKGLRLRCSPPPVRSQLIAGPSSTFEGE